MPTRPRSVNEIDFTPRGPVFPSPVDWRDQFIYSLLIDRFDDAKDHPPFNPKTTPRGGRDRERAHHFQGGTLKGVTRRMDYIKGLGCTAVWISPPFKQRQDDPTSTTATASRTFSTSTPASARPRTWLSWCGKLTSVACT
jgi:hypothetical protein